MKQRSILLTVVVLILCAVVLPNVAGWVIRDFMHQTMRLACDFDKASVNPLKGNLVLRNLSIKNDASNNLQANAIGNKVDTVWANYSLPQLMFRRLDTSLIALDGITIADCDESSSELPTFAMGSRSVRTDSFKTFKNEASTSQQISIALSQSSFQRSIESEKNRIEKELKDCNNELERLKAALQSISSTPVNQSNRLRTELDAKRIAGSIAQSVRLSKELEAKLARQEASILKALPAAQNNALVDWMSWSDHRRNTVETIDTDEVVSALLSEYARHLIKPMHAPLITTHSISKWSTLEPVSTKRNESNNTELANGDFFFNQNDVLPFDYKIIKLRGRSLIGSEPLAMTGTLTKASRSKATNLFIRPTTLEMRFSSPSTTKSGLEEVSPASIRTKANYAPASQTHQILVQYSYGKLLTIRGLGVDPYDSRLEANIEASNPRAELLWSIQEDRWKCRFDLYSSEVTTRLNVPNQATPEQIWKHSVPEKDFAVFHVDFHGKLEGGSLDNSQESIQSPFAKEIALAFKEFFRRQTESDLVAEKKMWVQESDRLISGLQNFQNSANREIRQNLDSVEVEIKKEQERLANALSDPSEIRFSRKSAGDQPATLSR